MEQLTVEVYRQRASLELAALVRYQHRPRGRIRQESLLLQHCVQEVLAQTPTERWQEGPWRVGQRRLKRRGRGGLGFIPLAQRGATAIMLSTSQEAEELVAFLNCCGMDEFGRR